MEGWEMEGWKNGEMEGTRDGEMERWRDGKMEGTRDGEMEGWEDGGMEGTRNGEMEGWKAETVTNSLEMTWQNTKPNGWPFLSEKEAK